MLAHEPDGDRAQVEFVARFREGSPERGRVGQLHERSRFVRHEVHWLYLDGT